jgi:hypothetical protein
MHVKLAINHFLVNRPRERGHSGAVARHPIRLVVTDDLERNRLTVGFRIILAIPHLVWLSLFTIGVLLVAVINWFATLFKGRSPDGIHDLNRMYVRYAAHVYAYLFLAASPWPSFSPNADYPVTVEVDPPARQSRWKTGFRLFLSLPALLISSALGGFSGGNGGSGRTGEEFHWTDLALTLATGAGVAFVVAVCAWWAILVTGRMPLGFRDLVAYSLRFAAQLNAYFFLLTDRYPDADPFVGPARPAPRHQPIRISIEDDLRRSRLTVFFRFLLFLPHLVWLVLWGIAAFVTAVLNWVATLVMGRSPDAFHRFLARYLRYQTHVFAFVYVIANPFPGFTGLPERYPVDLEIDPRERQHRAITLFRLVLAIPAFLVSSALGGLLILSAFFGWWVSLILGRMPLSLRNAGAFVLRYQAQVNGYAVFLLTDRYPYSGPAERARAAFDEFGPPPPPPTWGPWVPAPEPPPLASA